MVKFLQRIGKSLMLPIACLPIAGLMLRLGQGDIIDKLNELDTTGVEPMSHVFPVNNVFREDVVTNGDDRDEILANAPAKKDGAFMVPKTVE